MIQSPNRLLLILVACAAYSTGFAGEVAKCQPGEFLDKHVLEELANATTAADLRAVYGAYAYHLPPEDMLYAIRLYELEPSDQSEVLVLTSAPAYPFEFELWNAVTDPKFSDVKRLNELYLSHFDLLARLSAKHPEFIPRLLLQNEFSDGAVVEATTDALTLLKKLEPKRYKEARKWHRSRLPRVPLRAP